jgi:nucleotide-binding universal stress UspA family protein
MIEMAKKLDANLISIMTEQETRTSNLWMGPFAHQTVNHSPIPVLSIHPKEVHATGQGF